MTAKKVANISHGSVSVSTGLKCVVEIAGESITTIYSSSSRWKKIWNGSAFGKFTGAVHAVAPFCSCQSCGQMSGFLRHHVLCIALTEFTRGSRQIKLTATRDQWNNSTASAQIADLDETKSIIDTTVWNWIISTCHSETGNADLWMHASVPGKVYQPFNTKFNFTVLCGNCHAKNQLYPFKLRPHQQRCRSNNVEATFDFVEATLKATLDFVKRIVRLVRLATFDNVVSTLLPVWTRL